MSLADENMALSIAVSIGTSSPCEKSKRGVVIWRPGDSESFMGGYNHPPSPFKCDGSEACRASCGKVCVHAEAHALLGAKKSVRGMDMLHVKVVDGEAVASGPPSCWQCSRLMLEAGVAGMWLLHEDGLRRYDIEEFHALTLQHCGLPVIREGS